MLALLGHGLDVGLAPDLVTLGSFQGELLAQAQIPQLLTSDDLASVLCLALYKARLQDVIDGTDNPVPVNFSSLTYLRIERLALRGQPYATGQEYESAGK